jgi:hypothetical protein
MVRALRTVNGLAVEILFFLKKMEAKQFADGILNREFKERRSLRWSPVKDPAHQTPTSEGTFESRLPPDCFEFSVPSARAAPF